MATQRSITALGLGLAIAVLTGIAANAVARSNDPIEVRDKRWQEILTTAGVREVVAFLGREVLY